MSTLMLKVPCSKLAYCLLNRQSQITASFSTKKKKVVSKVLLNPGLRHLEKIHEDDPDFFDSLEENCDDTLEEMNFMQLDEAYDDHLWEKKWKKIKVERAIAAKQFFKPKAEPCMLTYSEREHIKFLHKSDPIQWDVKTLSENFPATTYVVKKILKSKWNFTPEKQKKLDEKVKKNWQLLAENKLDADPDVIEHFKKFVNNRNIIQDHLKNDNFYLPEVKVQKTYNNNEMSKIITHYENCLTKLIEDWEVTQTSDKNLPDKKRKSVDVLYEEIKKYQSIKELENTESFLLGKMVKEYQEDITLEKLEKQISTKATKNESLNLHEKAIFEKKLDEINQNNNVNDYFLDSIEANASSIEIHFDKGDSSDLPLKSSTLEKAKNENLVNISASKNNEKIFKIKSSVSDDKKQSTMGKTPLLQPNTEPQNEIHFKPIDTIGEDKKINFFKNEEADVSVNSGSTLENHQNEPENSLENSCLENEDKDLENTAFWNNNENYKTAVEIQKAPLGPTIYKKKTDQDLISEEPYPLRIIIPKEKRRLGSTYKLKDCYYDDDGRFLYRVPGMMK